MKTPMTLALLLTAAALPWSTSSSAAWKKHDTNTGQARTYTKEVRAERKPDPKCLRILTPEPTDKPIWSCP